MCTYRRQTPQGGTCDVNGLLGSTGDAAISTLELRELDQGLSLEGHHHHITKKTPTEAFRAGTSAQVQRNHCCGSTSVRSLETASLLQSDVRGPGSRHRNESSYKSCRQGVRRADAVSPYGSKLLQSVYQVCLHHSLTETSDVHHGAGRDPVGVSIIVLQHTQRSLTHRCHSHIKRRGFLRNETANDTNAVCLPSAT